MLLHEICSWRFSFALQVAFLEELACWELLSDFSFSARRKIDQDNVRILTIAIKENLLPIGRNIETSVDESRAQMSEVAELAGGQIEQRKILQPQHSLADHQALSIGKKSISIAYVSYSDLRKGEWMPVESDPLQPHRCQALSHGVKVELAPGSARESWGLLKMTHRGEMWSAAAMPPLSLFAARCRRRQLENAAVERNAKALQRDV